jgi:hypothetical protein
VKVNINKPVPAPTPPTTYDLVSLSADEFRMIKHMLGKGTIADAEKAGCTNTAVGYSLFGQLQRVAL